MKKTTRKKTTTKTAKLPPAPTGLKFLLSLLDEGGNPDDAIYARARHIIGELDVWRGGEWGATKGDENTRVVFPLLPNDEDPNADTVMHAGVLLGAAVAWVLMTDLQGGGR